MKISGSVTIGDTTSGDTVNGVIATLNVSDALGKNIYNVFYRFRWL